MLAIPNIIFFYLRGDKNVWFFFSPQNRYMCINDHQYSLPITTNKKQSDKFSSSQDILIEYSTRFWEHSIRKQLGIISYYACTSSVAYNCRYFKVNSILFEWKFNKLFNAVCKSAPIMCQPWKWEWGWDVLICVRWI